MRKVLYAVLALANGMVLLGQLWPEGAPAFAHQVTVGTLAIDVLVFLLLFQRARGGGKKQ
jgi:hypothetical protein